MKDYFAVVLLAYFMATTANLVNSQSNLKFIVGSCCKEIKQQLAEIKEEIRAIRNAAGTKCGNIGQQLVESKKEILKEKKATKRNETVGNCDKVPSAYKDCAEVYKSGNNISGVYKINPDGFGEFEAFCDHKTAGGGWTVFQKRFNGSVDFFRAWDDYKRGFGNLNGEFWLGLDKIHRLTVSGGYKLRVDLEDIHGKTAFAEYSSFSVTNETAKYQLNLGSYSGTAGDSFYFNRGVSFSTKDSDNDNWGSDCASFAKGAWWYRTCTLYSSLNGLYLPGKSDYRGICWYYGKKTCVSFKGSEMKIRPKGFLPS